MENREDVFTEEEFRDKYKYEEFKNPPLRERIKRELKCSKETFLNLFPIVRWLSHYSIKNQLLYDMIAGLTVAVMHVPHGLSYAPLGRVEPVVGLYMAIFPVLVYMIMGTSRHISLGTFAVLCAMVGEIVDENTSSESKDLISNSTVSNEDKSAAKDYNLDIGITVCLLVGIWQGILGLLKLGILMVILSNSLISGFTTGAAFYVFTYQLKHLFGIKVASFKGLLRLFYIYADFFSKILTTNLVTLGISASTVVILIIFREFIKPYLTKKFPKTYVPIPIELFVIVIGIFISYFLKLSEDYSVEIVDHVPKGFPYPRVPPIKLLPFFIFESFVVAVVALAINLSLAKIFAKKEDYVIFDNQELLAYGASNVVSSFFLCLPSAASLSRSTIQYAAGGKTQLTSFFSAVLVLFIVLFAGPLFEPVPKCVLSSIVIVTLKGMLFQILDLPKIWKESYWDGIVWIGTFLAVVILDIDIGLGVGVALSILVLAFSSTTLRVSVLGRVPDTDEYLDPKYYKAAVPLPNILILRIEGNITFANCNRLTNKILSEYKLFSTFSIEDESNVVLDIRLISKVDPTSINALKQLYKYLLDDNCKLFLAHCNREVYKSFEKCSFFEDFPRENVVASISGVVANLSKLS